MFTQKVGVVWTWHEAASKVLIEMVRFMVPYRKQKKNILLVSSTNEYKMAPSVFLTESIVKDCRELEAAVPVDIG